MRGKQEVKFSRGRVSGLKKGLPVVCRQTSSADEAAFISSGAEQTGTYGGEVNGKVAGCHFEHLLRETT